MRPAEMLPLWKLRITRAAGYLSIVNTLMLLYVFSKQLYDWPFVREHFEFRQFVALAYSLALIGFIILAEIDWHYIYRREIGFQVSRNPMAVTECFRSAFMLYQAEQAGKDVGKAFQKLRKAFRLAGYEEEFMEFWKILHDK